jgi:hypothetical protein
MRTVIYIGLLSIADAINADLIKDGDGRIPLMSIVLISAIFMDCADFYRKQTKD